MRLVEFLIQVLEAQAETLRRLAALFGEENLLALLEMAGEDEQRDQTPDFNFEVLEQLKASRAETAWPPGGSGTYGELEGAVREFHLPEVLEFYLWAYPFYRVFIESELDLDTRIPGPGGDTGNLLVDEAMKQAQVWIRRLPIVASLALQAERAAHVPWLRFRTSVLKRIGKRPLGPVY